jgi:SAM-dependent methyltransferase
MPATPVPTAKGAFTMGTSPEMKSAWTQHWKAGHAASLPNAQSAPALVAIHSAWKEFLSEAPDKVRLLDLATGGGDVVRRAIAEGRNISITGVDIADLSAVSAALQAPGIELIGNTDLSNLPFSDGTFDRVTSQFGIEYADHAAATREAVRVLAPGGRGLFIHHHSDSVITQGTANSLAAYREVFTDNSAFRLGRTLFELSRNGAPRTDIEDAESMFKGAVATLESRLRNEPRFNPVRRIVDMFTMLAGAPGSSMPADALRMLDEAEEHIHASNLRKVAEIKSALDEDGVQRFAALLTDAGATVSQPQVLSTPSGRALAWSLAFRR